MDPTLSSLVFIVFIVAILFLLFSGNGNIAIGSWSLHTSVELSEYDLGTFLKRNGKGLSSRKKYIFSEESLVSMTYRYNGRFDSVIVRWTNGPILDSVIERKFPARHLPTKAIDADVFQGSLYALALKEKGLSVESTRILNTYCLQDDAKRCLEKNRGLNCLKCRKGVTFKKKFNEARTIKSIQRLDEIWYRGRKPNPKSEKNECRICPFSDNGLCNYSNV